MPRKTHGGEVELGLAAEASMRPRPDAAENASCAPACAGTQAASMRPRPDAAENGAGGDALGAGPQASMRPRPDAAENAARFLPRPARRV